MGGNDMQGMRYEEVRKKLNSINNNKNMHPEQKHNLTRSLLNQARRRDGEGAVRELRREVRC